MAKVDELAEVFCRIDKPKTMNRFFSEIFTASECRDFALRWKLMKMLKQGLPQRKIASELGISLCKITRGAKIIKNASSVTNSIMNKIRKPAYSEVSNNNHRYDKTRCTAGNR